MLDLFVKMTGLPEPAAETASETPTFVLRGIGHVIIGGVGLGLGIVLGSILALLVGFFALQLC